MHHALAPTLPDSNALGASTLEPRALRPVLRQRLERAAHWLELYGLLLSWRPSPAQLDAVPLATESFRVTLEALVTKPQLLPLSLHTRATLCNLLHEVEAQELSSFIQALLEHVALSLEPSLQLALLDPLQRPHYQAMLEHYGLEQRPFQELLSARELRQALASETRERSVVRRRKLSA